MKTKHHLLAGVVLSILFAAASAPAQYNPNFYNYPGFFGGGYGGYGYASTYEEGVQRGMADVIRSRGAANLMNSAAANNWQDATTKYIQNRQQWTQAYFEMRQMNRQYRAQEALPKPSSEDLYRYAKDAAPDRLGPTQLDPLTATINWPLALKAQEFEQQRNQMEQLFAKRNTAEGMASPDTYFAINQLAAQMDAMLKQHASEYDANTYMASKRFIKSLAYESTMQPSS